MTVQQTDIGHDRGWLTPEAAASIARIDRLLGHPLQITEAGRSFFRQEEHYQAYLAYLAGGPWAPIALSPEAPSIHQLGNAIDSDEAQHHVDLLAEHGWKRTVYRNGKLVEPWHFEYDISRDQHVNDPAPDPTTTLQEDTDMIAIRQTGLPDSGIILQPGVPPYSLPEQVFLTQASSFGLTIHDLPDWRYGTAVREHWAAYSVAQNARPSMSQADVDRIAAATRDAMEKALPK